MVEESEEYTTQGRYNTKDKRVNDCQGIREKLPVSYRENSHKEELCLKYTDNFLDQLSTIFPERDPLFVIPVNEYNVPKLVCTTIRPTQLPYKELYNAEACATFISDYITYEPLANPLEPPSCLPSPTMTLDWQIGDSFDMSTLLCSYLLGAGYDAYCVSGYAKREVTLRDLSKQKVKFPNQDNLPDPDAASDNQRQQPDAKLAAPEVQPAVVEEKSDVDDGDAAAADEGLEPAAMGGVEDPGSASAVSGDPYALPEEKSHESQFLKAISNREKASKSTVEEMEEEEQLTSEPVFENEAETDPLYGKRVHSWVLVRAGKRMVDESFFLEPSTGKMYQINNSPYLGISSIWNTTNYWVNVGSLDQPPENIPLDLDNNAQWEYIFLEAQVTEVEQGNETDDSDLEDDLDESKRREVDEDSKILDLPPSWVKKLVIARDRYRRKYGLTGQKVSLKWKAKEERYAPYLHPQGLVCRIFVFNDVQRTSIKSVHEYFDNRRDKLEKRVRYPFTGEVVETFLPGRPSGLKRFSTVAGRYRIFEYYTEARLDGLQVREERIGVKTIEQFVNRDDLLLYRSVTITQENAGEVAPGSRSTGGTSVVKSTKPGVKGSSSYVLPGGQLGDLSIAKMTEKFARDENRPADECVNKRTYFIEVGSIRVLYHYDNGRVTRSSRLFSKDRSIAPEVTVVDEFKPLIRQSQIEKEFQYCLQYEKDCYQAVRDAEREAQDILALRRRQEQTIVLDKSVFDTARERAKEDENNENKNEEKEEKDSRQVDYLTPFLPNAGPGGALNMTQQEAEAARDACLRALKERLLERANIIQRRLDEENMQLAKKQAAFQRSRDHVEGADEEFEKFCSDAMFRIQILEQRLARHEETALQKYADMDYKLRNDPRLARLHAGM